MVSLSSIYLLFLLIEVILSHMNIREKIGQRIYEARKAKNLTIKALGELTDDFKQTRITNWENGLRLPGPEEIKLLAKALDVSPAYLMCLSDDKQPKKIPGLGALVPLLDHHQASDPKTYIEAIKSEENDDKLVFIPLSLERIKNPGKYTFALKMIDDSMLPEIRPNDILIIDPSLSPSPGDYVAVKISGKNDVFICQYKQLSYITLEFELLTLNDKWPNISVNENIKVEIVGKVILNIRAYV